MLIVSCVMSRSCLINAICYLDCFPKDREAKFLVKYLYCNTLDRTGTLLWRHKLEPSSYMAHKQACYTFQPQVSQRHSKKKGKKNQTKT